MEFKLCLCTLSLLIVGKSHKILIVSRQNSPRKPESLLQLSHDVLNNEDELHYLSLMYPDDHEWEHGCRAAYFGAEISDQPGWVGAEISDQPGWVGAEISDQPGWVGAEISDQPGWVGAEISDQPGWVGDTDRPWENVDPQNSDIKVNSTSEVVPFDLIIVEKDALPSKSRMACWQPARIMVVIPDKIISLPADFQPLTHPQHAALSELPSKNFTERFNAIKQLLKYLISLCKHEGVTRARALVTILIRRGRLDAFQYSTRSHSYIEEYNIDVWCCIFTILAVLAGTAVYLVTIIILHILEKSRTGARIM